MDCSIMHIEAGTVPLSVWEFLARTQAHAAEQQWKHIQTKEAAQRIMLGWLKRDLTSLYKPPHNYALEYAKFSKGPGLCTTPCSLVPLVFLYVLGLSLFSWVLLGNLGLNQGNL